MPLPPAILSRHAGERTKQRFRISPEQLVALMNAGLGKRIGTSERTNLIHRLLWSPADDSLLVAIQEVISGTVLTVLTLEMYRRDYATNISEDRIRHVINQMVHAGRIPQAMWEPGGKNEYVTVHARLKHLPKAVALGRWTGPISSVDLSRLGENLQFWRWVVQRLEQRGHAVDSLVTVDARFSGGENQEVPFRVLGTASDATGNLRPKTHSERDA